VAGRLADEFYRPTVIVHVGEQVSQGSCRSIPEFDIIQALKQHRHLFTYFGGHAQAAGFTLPTKNLPRLEHGLVQLAARQLAGVELCPQLDIDAEVTLPQLRGNTFQEISRLAPFGCGNPVPVFLSREVKITSCRTMGSNREHLRLRLQQEGSVWDAVGFRMGNWVAEMSPLLDIVYNLELDSWGGEDRLRLNIVDFAPAA
jgi:single-stranded-DNA-specific exonuclease